MDALSLTAVEESQTAAAAEAADTQDTARWFFIAAALIALKIAVRPCGSAPNGDMPPCGPK